MAYETINDLMTGICDAIRTKEGSSEPIASQSIPTRIASLPTSSEGNIIEEHLTDDSTYESYTKKFGNNLLGKIYNKITNTGTTNQIKVEEGTYSVVGAPVYDGIFRSDRADIANITFKNNKSYQKQIVNTNGDFTIDANNLTVAAPINNCSYGMFISAIGMPFSLATDPAPIEFSSDYSDNSPVEIIINCDTENGSNVKSIEITGPKKGAPSKLWRPGTVQCDIITEANGDWVNIFTDIKTSTDVWTGSSDGNYQYHRVYTFNKITKVYKVRLTFITVYRVSCDVFIATSATEGTPLEDNNTYLFKNGEFIENEVVNLQSYSTSVSNGLLYGTDSAAGIWTNNIPDSKIIYAKVKTSDSYAHSIQYGTCSADASLPTIASTGAGRQTFSNKTIPYGTIEIISMERTDLNGGVYLALNNSSSNGCGIVSIWYEDV